MFYIINTKNQIIAADNLFLEYLNVKSIDELLKQIILENLELNTIDDDTLQLTSNGEAQIHKVTISSLSSLLGELQLVKILDKATQVTQSPIEIHDEAKNIDLISDDTSHTHDVEVNPLILEENSEDNVILLDIDSDSDTAEKNIDDELYELTIPTMPDIAIDTIPEEKLLELQDSMDHTQQIDFLEPTSKELLDTSDIVQDLSQHEDNSDDIILSVKEASENIGISIQDYMTFLNEYIDTSISHESDLKNTNRLTQSKTVDTLSQLANVLELPFVNGILAQLSNQNTQQHEEIITSFYTTLSRFTTEEETSSIVEYIDPKIIPINKDQVSEKIPEGFGTFTLEGIQPIHFDFRLEEAANDLSLPVELIEEFVQDFIAQARTETEKMLIAHTEGDLDAIQKIGHMLKGASSNLRINALSDTLYNIQFCEDGSKLEGFIKKYWGYLLSLEQRIDTTSK